jgi:hypothetical protein
MSIQSRRNAISMSQFEMMGLQMPTMHVEVEAPAAANIWQMATNSHAICKMDITRHQDTKSNRKSTAQAQNTSAPHSHI